MAGTHFSGSSMKQRTGFRDTYLLLRYGIQCEPSNAGVFPYSDANPSSVVQDHIDRLWAGLTQKTKTVSLREVAAELEATLRQISSGDRIVLLGSAGADSAILAGAAAAAGIPTSVLTIAFHDEWGQFDESSAAERLYAKIGLDHRTIQMNAGDIRFGAVKGVVRRFATPHAFALSQCPDSACIITGYGSLPLFGLGPVCQHSGLVGATREMLTRRTVFPREAALGLLMCDDPSAAAQIEDGYLTALTTFVEGYGPASTSAQIFFMGVILYGWIDFYSELIFQARSARKNVSFPFLNPSLLGKCRDYREDGRGEQLRHGLLEYYGLESADLTPSKRGFIPPVEMWLKRELFNRCDRIFQEAADLCKHSILNAGPVSRIWLDFGASTDYSGLWTGYCQVWLLLQILAQIGLRARD